MPQTRGNTRPRTTRVCCYVYEKCTRQTTMTSVSLYSPMSTRKGTTRPKLSGLLYPQPTDSHKSGIIQPTLQFHLFACCHAVAARFGSMSRTKRAGFILAPGGSVSPSAGCCQDVAQWVSAGQCGGVAAVRICTGPHVHHQVGAQLEMCTTQPTPTCSPPNTCAQRHKGLPSPFRLCLPCVHRSVMESVADVDGDMLHVGRQPFQSWSTGLIKNTFGLHIDSAHVTKPFALAVEASAGCCHNIIACGR